LGPLPGFCLHSAGIFSKNCPTFPANFLIGIPMTADTSASTFSNYQRLLIAILALLQFTVILDFMVLSPLGAILLDELHITTAQFGMVVSVYAFSAGASGLLAAGFADRYDRKKLLLFFYTGFIIGTLLCALATSYWFLLIARLVTGIFGGVIGSVSYAIISDLFPLNLRGRVMGFVQMAFSASQVLGIPLGLLLATEFNWHAPFWMIVLFSIALGMVILWFMKPVDEHLASRHQGNAFVHMYKTLTQPLYLRAFLTTTLLATGGFMLMPFSSAFSTNNLGLTLEQLPVLYGVTGIFTIMMGPMVGKISDRAGKYKVFAGGSVLSMIMVAIFTNLGHTPLYLVIILNVIFFAAITSRMIPASALMTGIPEQQDRGAFMSINSSVQQISGGVAASVAGLIVVQQPGGKLEHYNTLGLVVIGSMVITMFMMRVIDRQIKNTENVKQTV
jgi:predicted MFS family arabinose efflux permease